MYKHLISWRERGAIALLLATFLSTSAMAHEDIGLAVEGTKIVTGNYDFSGTAGGVPPLLVVTGEPLGETEASRAGFTGAFDGGGELGFGAATQAELDLDNPPPGTYSAFGGGAVITADYIPLTAGDTGNLLMWNGAGFSNVASTITLSITGGDTLVASVTGADNGLVAGFNVGTTAGDGSLHDDLALTLEDTGAGEAPPGVYLAGIQYDSPLLDNADPFYMLIGAFDPSNAGTIEDTIEAADEWLEANVFDSESEGGTSGIPEPTSLLTLGAMIFFLTARKRRKQQRA